MGRTAVNPPVGLTCNGYSGTSRRRTKTGNPVFGPTEQLRRRTTRFSRALEVVSSNDYVKGGYVNEGTQRGIMKMVIFPYKVVIVDTVLITINMAKMD